MHARVCGEATLVRLCAHSRSRCSRVQVEAAEEAVRQQRVAAEQARREAAAAAQARAALELARDEAIGQADAERQRVAELEEELASIRESAHDAAARMAEREREHEEQSALQVRGKVPVRTSRAHAAPRRRSC